MYVIVVYDINQKRVGKALKICRKYLVHVQKSVFEGTITEAKLERLKKEMSNLINPAEDAIVIYRFESSKYAQKEQIGTVTERPHII